MYFRWSIWELDPMIIPKIETDSVGGATAATLGEYDTGIVTMV